MRSGRSSRRRSRRRRRSRTTASSSSSSSTASRSSAANQTQMRKRVIFLTVRPATVLFAPTRALDMAKAATHLALVVLNAAADVL